LYYSPFICYVTDEEVLINDQDPLYQLMISFFLTTFMFGPGCCWSLIVISEGSGSRRGTISPSRVVTAMKGTKNCASRAKLFLCANQTRVYCFIDVLAAVAVFVLKLSNVAVEARSEERQPYSQARI